MAIKIGTLPSPHDAAAAEIQSEVVTTMSENNEETDKKVEFQSEPVQFQHPWEAIEVGTSFKMPVAAYTMLEFSVRRYVPYDPVTTDPDTVFEEARAWVEGKLNAVIEEQQAAMQDQQKQQAQNQAAA